MEPRNQDRQGRGPALRESQSPCGKVVPGLWASEPSVKPLEQVQVRMNEQEWVAGVIPAVLLHPPALITFPLLGVEELMLTR